MKNLDEILQNLKAKKQRLDKYRPFPKEILESLKKYFDLELTHHSTAIEGNTLSLKETKLVLEEGITIGGKTLKEHLEVKNHREALDFIETLVKKKTTEISEKDILKIHQIVLKEISKEAGKYRNVTVRIVGSRAILPSPQKVPTLMTEFIKWLNTPAKDHSIKLATDVHYKLVSIHPFVDGNGRVARLLMNLILMQHGWPPALIKLGDRKEYIDALEKAQTGGSLDDFYGIICRAEARSFDIYLEALEKKIYYK